MKLSFTKMQGCANDYIYLDCRESGVPAQIEELSERLSARHFSIGADGIICICAPETPGAQAKMRIFNADGSEAKMCGNGIRCVAQWLREHDAACAQQNSLLLDTQSGPRTLTWCNGLWRVAMGRYSALPEDLPAVGLGENRLIDVPLCAAGKTWRVSCISVGNPHCVVVVEDVNALRLEELGPAFEKHPAFPRQVNTEFVQPVDRTHVKMRVWERGSGETFACGTGASAAVAALTELGLCDKNTETAVELLGGTLMIRVADTGEIEMTGPAKTVCEGFVNV